MTSSAKTMPKLIGGLCALATLGAGILHSVEPWTCILRGFFAYIIGSFGCQVWNMVLTPPTFEAPSLEVEPSEDKDQQQDEEMLEAS